MQKNKTNFVKTKVFGLVEISGKVDEVIIDTYYYISKVANKSIIVTLSYLADKPNLLTNVSINGHNADLFEQLEHATAINQYEFERALKRALSHIIREASISNLSVVNSNNRALPNLTELEFDELIKQLIITS